MACAAAARARDSWSSPSMRRDEAKRMPRVPAATAVSAASDRLSGSTARPLLPTPESVAACQAVRGSISVESVDRSGVPGRVSRGRSRSQVR